MKPPNTEGSEADECGRAIRYYRERAMHAAEIADLDPCYLQDYACWDTAEIGESYEWAAPLPS